MNAAAQTAACIDRLADLVTASRRLVVLGGAGVSTDSGIPDYRDEDGQWKHSAPVMYQAFASDAGVRRRYWARSLIGWRHIASAAPGVAHRALALLERHAALHWLITQNVDGLHTRAGSRRVIELHGRLDGVVCMDCGSRGRRDELQRRLEAANPAWAAEAVPAGPDGDALVGARDYSGFTVPQCLRCGGRLKPDVVFFGESVPRERVAQGMSCIAEADALLVVGSSLMVFSGFRFVREAARLNLPIAAINLGRTRADDLFTVKVSAPCGEVLGRLADFTAGAKAGNEANAAEGLTSAGAGFAPRGALR